LVLLALQKFLLSAEAEERLVATHTEAEAVVVLFIKLHKYFLLER
jgi:hypothetical protein